MLCNIFIEKEPGYNCKHQAYSEQSPIWIDMLRDCLKMFVLFLKLP